MTVINLIKFNFFKICLTKINKKSVLLQISFETKCRVGYCFYITITGNGNAFYLCYHNKSSFFSSGTKIRYDYCTIRCKLRHMEPTVI